MHAPFHSRNLSTKAMEAGSHVLIEKPMSTSIEDADEMIACSKKNNVRLGVVHQNIFNPAVLKAKELFGSGKMGDLLHVELRTSEDKNGELCTNKDHWCHKLLGGIFGEIAPHPVYLMQQFLKDAKPTMVAAKKLNEQSFMKYDELRVLLEVKNGFGTIIVSCNSLIQGDTLDIFGSKLALHADLYGRTVILYKPQRASAIGAGMSNLSLSAQLIKVLGSTASTFIKAATGKQSAHYYVINQFVQSLIDKTEYVTTAEIGRATVTLLNLICAQL